MKAVAILPSEWLEGCRVGRDAQVRCPPLPVLISCLRYSHTAHVHCGKLLLVGGVWLHAPLVPGVAVIDLATGFTAEYRIDVVSDSCVEREPPFP